MKKFTSILLILVLSISTTLTVSAQGKDLDTVQIKKEMVKYAKDYIQKAGVKNNLDEKELRNILRDYASGKSNYSIEDLKNYGIFIMPKKGFPSLRSVAGDVRFDSFNVAYISWYKEWVFQGQVEWSNDSWKEGFLPLHGGGTRNVGGADVVGIKLYDTNAAPSDLKILSSLLVVGNGGDKLEDSRSYETLENLDIENGVYFSFQDTYSHKMNIIGQFYDHKYFGQNAWLEVIYNDAFTNYSGKAAMFYTHTFNTTQLSGINLSINKNIPKISVDFYNGTSLWTGYSNYETF